MTPKKLASLLGRLGKGKPKTLTKAQRREQAARLAKVRHLRWQKKPSVRP